MRSINDLFFHCLFKRLFFFLLNVQCGHSPGCFLSTNLLSLNRTTTFYIFFVQNNHIVSCDCKRIATCVFQLFWNRLINGFRFDIYQNFRTITDHCWLFLRRWQNMKQKKNDKNSGKQCTGHPSDGHAIDAAVLWSPSISRWKNLLINKFFMNKFRFD